MILHKTVKRISIAFLPMLFISLSLIAFNCMNQLMLEMHIQSYARAACMQGALFSLSAITVFLGLTQYWLLRHKMALVLSVISFVLGFINAHDLWNINNAFKAIVYALPCTYLIINYIFHYNTIIDKQKKLQYIAAHDALTGLYNRREFEVLLTNTIANSARHNEYFALFAIDIDDFKSINDTLGHVHGDDFLQQFAKQLSSLTRNGETLARIGGDEFALIATRLESPVSAKKIGRAPDKRIKHIIPN